MVPCCCFRLRVIFVGVWQEKYEDGWHQDISLGATVKSAPPDFSLSVQVFEYFQTSTTLLLGRV